MPKLSFVIPVKDEEESLDELYDEIVAGISKIKPSFELIFIDDGSKDGSYKKLLNLAKKDKRVEAIRLRANFGKSRALAEGFKQVKGDTIVTLDADLQDDPGEIPNLLSKLEEGYDLVSGWRKERNDPLSKKISSKLFNSGTAFISKVDLHDFNCGLKVFKREVAEDLYLHGELHRFIPVLAAKMKFRVTEIPVKHRERKYGKSKYGLERSWRGIVDLFTTVFISDYSTKPAHFFGKIGLVFFLIGLVMDGYVTYIKLTTGSTQGHLPLLLAGILFILLGVQLLSTGLIAEMIVHQNRSSRS